MRAWLRYPALAVTAVVALTGCGSAASPELLASPDVERVVVSVADYPDEVEALRSSAFRLGAAMLAGSQAENQVTSPVSALYALSMLRAGARTTTAAELDEVLGFPAANRDEAMNALLAQWQEHDGDPGSVDEEEPPEQPLLHLANGLFVDNDLSVREEFLNTLAGHYGSGIYPVDYGDPATQDKLGAWISENTGGRIEEAPVEYDPDTVLSIINTVYFAAAWQAPFEPELTGDGDFNTATGPRRVDMMHHAVTGNYASGDGWQAMDLPYNNGFAMRLVLPDEGESPVMDEAALAAVADAMAGGTAELVDLTLPKWDHHYKQEDLKTVLKDMGLTEAMGEAPDYSGIAQDLFVSGAAQDANITVAEAGTVAAAVTQIGMESSAPPPPELTLTFDRPFQYQIIHVETGMPIFLGTVMDPAP
ncbi:serpin family protein [Arthrobacter sp. H5]|uniref:serpin family protein n=1 Tax=Arthrobacter sp. H5 TaxID=1267973 RepID=UPI0004869A8F|nr:serpin family protein [Arthrobacter sp. H5]